MDAAAISPDPLELTLSQERFERRQERVIRDEGYGATDGALAISTKILPRAIEAFQADLEAKDHGKCERERIRRAMRLLPLETVALCAISQLLHAIGLEKDLRGTALQIGAGLAQELWAHTLQGADAKLAKDIERRARARGTFRFRQQTARSLAKRGGYAPTHEWSREESLQAGNWALTLLTEHLSDVFILVEGDSSEMRPTITEGALQIAQRACAEMIRRNPVWLPSAAAPRPWTGFMDGGPVDVRMQRSVTLVRSHHKETASLVNAAIASGQMQPCLNALNSIQATPWVINHRVLDVLRECVNRHIPVPGLPSAQDIPMPVKGVWEEMTPQEQVLWKIKAQETKRANHALVGERIGLTEDLETAEQLGDLERFYTACNIDWRGRVYPLPHFNFQREDRVRGLFLFEDGEPIGDGDGLKWLQIHTANCGDFDKVSKKPFEDRQQWTIRHTARIQQMVARIAEDPMADLWWTQADKPFLFLAACFELTSALAEGPKFVTRLPVSWDGSCSGLQHLCAMTRAEEGEFVNLTASPSPQDVYQRVADAAKKDITADLTSESEHLRRVAAQCLTHGVNRSVVKRNVMTYSYSSKKFGMGHQQMEDLMRPLSLEVLKGTIAEHPFGQDEGFAASKYLAGKVYAGIEQIVTLPAQAMGFLQKLAKVMAHEGKPLSWVTPIGLPWVNRYHEVNYKRVTLWLRDRGVALSHKVLLATDYKKAIDKAKASNGVAPNFVHALDAAHLMLTVNAAKAEGLNSFALVHDSFGCLASRAGRFHGIIREQFVQMYETHDVLTEVLQQATCALDDHNSGKLPDVVQPGTLNIKEVLDAQYAFA